MSAQDDELLQLFLEESKEHLDGIEDDLLTIEQLGADIDLDLINRVFRAVHSIKGAAGFFGLLKVKELSHAAENVFGQIRKSELVPTPEIISIMLESMDVLTSMINSAESSEEVDISSYLESLEAILTDNLPSERKEEPKELMDIAGSDGSVIFQVSRFEMEEAQKTEKGGSYYYVLEYDLLNDIERKGKTPWDVISELLLLTHFIDSKIDIDKVGNLETLSDSVTIPFYILISTTVDPDLMDAFVDLDKSKIKQLSFESNQEDTASPEPVKETAAKPVVETPVAEVKQEVLSEPVKKEEPKAVQAKPTKPKKKMRQTSVKTELTSVRVNIQVLDKLMTLAGEMVLTRNQLLQSVSLNEMRLIERATQRVDLITAELQDAIMSTRMQSVGIVFNKFKRVVHDMSRDLDKDIDLVLEGEDVELDKTIIESIGDPLTHLVRNSIDHGIEMPEERLRAGKQQTGRLRLSAFHKAGQVIIEVADDGDGIDVERVKDKALKMGLHSMEELAAMNENSLLRLIFKPGFSTAKEVTDISGRGVGMDVVYSNLSKIGGVVDIESDLHKGTTVRIKLPLTLAILPSLLVDYQGQRFAIPQVSLVELQRIPAKDVYKKIERIGNVNVLRLRGELLPIISLSDVFDIQERTYIDPETNEALVDSRENVADRRTLVEEESLPAELADKRSGLDRRFSTKSAVNVVIVAAGDYHYGIIVDNLLDSSEIVVKPLGRHLSECRGYAGATILGDGKAALILDVIGISQQMNLGDSSDVSLGDDGLTGSQKSAGQDMQSLLVVENAIDEHFAIPLVLVERIEKIHKNQIEVIGNRRSMKYRSTSLMLFAIEDVAEVSPREDRDTLFVIVFKIGGREAGVIVSQLVDIIDVDCEVDGVTHKQPGIYGSMIIEDKTTLYLDLHGMVKHMMPDWTVTEEKAPVVVEGDGKKRILIVEDSKFFLNQISGFVQEAGYDVFTAIDGLDALKVLEEQESKIDLMLTDIEMPNLDGFGLVEKMRKHPSYENIPVIAITSVMGDAAEQKGKDVGIDEYLIKLDQEQILSHTRELLRTGRK